jgi:hypothetical protein
MVAWCAAKADVVLRLVSLAWGEWERESLSHRTEMAVPDGRPSLADKKLSTSSGGLGAESKVIAGAAP